MELGRELTLVVSVQRWVCWWNKHALGGFVSCLMSGAPTEGNCMADGSNQRRCGRTASRRREAHDPIMATAWSGIWQMEVAGVADGRRRALCWREDLEVKLVKQPVITVISHAIPEAVPWEIAASSQRDGAEITVTSSLSCSMQHVLSTLSTCRSITPATAASSVARSRAAPTARGLRAIHAADAWLPARCLFPRHRCVGWRRMDRLRMPHPSRPAASGATCRNNPCSCSSQNPDASPPSLAQRPRYVS